MSKYQSLASVFSIHLSWKFCMLIYSLALMFYAYTGILIMAEGKSLSYIFQVHCYEKNKINRMLWLTIGISIKRKRRYAFQCTWHPMRDHGLQVKLIPSRFFSKCLKSFFTVPVPSLFPHLSTYTNGSPALLYPADSSSFCLQRTQSDSTQGSVISPLFTSKSLYSHTFPLFSFWRKMWFSLSKTHTSYSLF